MFVEWYHGDAYGLNEKNSSTVIGFRCHLCRKHSSPICPHMRSTTSPVAPKTVNLLKADI